MLNTKIIRESRFLSEKSKRMAYLSFKSFSRNIIIISNQILIST